MVSSIHKSMRRLALAFSLLAISIPVSTIAVQADQTLNYRDADIRAVVDDVARMTGRTFIIDPRVNGKVTIISRSSIPDGDVFSLFLSTLRVYGFTAVSTINGAYKIVPEEMAVLDTTATPMGSDGDRLVTEIFRLQTLDPIIALNTLKPLVNRQGRVIAQQNQNFIIVVDYANNLARLRDVLAEIDKDTSVTRMVSLENTSAPDMADTIGQLRRQGGGQNAQDSSLTIVPVGSSNMLILKGSTKTVTEVAGLISAIDQKNTEKGAIKVVYLQHADAEKMVPMLEQVSKSMMTADGGEQGAKQQHASVSFHQATNALVISASPEMQKTLEGVISQLDIPRARILVEAIIVEVSDRAAKELGLQYVLSDADGSTIPFTAASYSNSASSILAATGAALLGTGSDVVDDDGLNPLRRAAFDSLFQNNGYSGGFATRSGNGTIFGVILNALDQDIGSNILSTPSVMTLDNEPARLIVGQEIPITTGEALGTANTNPFRTIERQDVGIKLEVRPQINVGKNIKLYIKQEVSSILGPVSSGSSELITNKREIETTVMAEDGEIIVLGGLIEQDEQITLDKVPLLGDIPLIGRAFRNEQKSRTKTNLMVFLRPMIIKDAAHMGDVTARKYNLMRREQLLNGDGKEGAAIDRLLDEVLGAEPPKSAGAEPQ